MYGNRENYLAIFGNRRRMWYAPDTDFHYPQIWMQLLGFEMIICFTFWLMTEKAGHKIQPQIVIIYEVSLSDK